MGRKRKLMTGVAPIGGPSLKSRKAAREVTSRYHSIRNELENIKVASIGNSGASDQHQDVHKNKNKLSDEDNSKKIAALEAELQDIGGTNRYQEASIVSTQHFKTSRWVISTIDSNLGRSISYTAAHNKLRSPKGEDGGAKHNSTLGADDDEEEEEEQNNDSEIAATEKATIVNHTSTALVNANATSATTPTKKKPKQEKQRLQVLEVGAINIQLQHCNWLDVRAIDVNSQHPKIQEVDFFDVPNHLHYDALVSSMVVNCVPVPSKRGEMLLRMRCHLRRDDSLMLLVLPSRCVDGKYISLGKNKKYNHNNSSKGKPKNDKSGRRDFVKLLTALGYSEVAIAKETPHLVFYTMRRGALLCEHDQSQSQSQSQAGEQGKVKQYPWQEEAKLHLAAFSAPLRKHYDRDLDGTVPVKDFAVSFEKRLWG